MIGEPRIDYRGEKHYVGIRRQVPMKGMSAVVTQMFKELSAWRNYQVGLKVIGSPLLRFHVIDMRGEMDIETGIPVAGALPEDGDVRAAVLPAGYYASLVYTGSGLSGNKALIEWARSKELDWDRWDSEKGDNFRARYESYLTDPNAEPRKARWEIEVAIKLAEEHSQQLSALLRP